MKVIVTSSGAEQIAHKNIAETQGWEYVPFNNFEGITKSQADMILFLGWYVPDLRDWWQYKFRYQNIPKVVVLWAGSDILQCQKMWSSGAKQMFKEFVGDQFCHVPESEFQKDELLKRFNLQSTDPLASPTREALTDIPIPEAPVAGIYAPTARYDFYRLQEIAQGVADAKIKGIYYHFLFEYTKLSLPGELDKRFAITWDEYKKVIADSSFGIRLPIHDGLSVGASEFLMAGRPMITCQDMPRWPRVIKGDVTVEKITKAIQAVIGGDYYVPLSVREFYRDYFDPAKYKQRLAERLATKWDGFTFGE